MFKLSLSILAAFAATAAVAISNVAAPRTTVRDSGATTSGDVGEH